MESDNMAFMERAIELARYTALEKHSGGPFGAVIVYEGKIIAEGRNRVIETNDPTWHAEMDAIRQASTQALKNFKLSGCTLYTSSEPCPMCMSACYWAGIEQIYYASTVEDAQRYGNFDDSFIYEEFLRPLEKRKIQCVNFMREETLPLWKKYSALETRVQY